MANLGGDLQLSEHTVPMFFFFQVIVYMSSIFFKKKTIELIEPHLTTNRRHVTYDILIPHQ